MHIFIDESGGFQRAPARDHSISCVGAAIIPGRYLSNVEEGFRALSAEWPRENGEVKGKLLNEQHFEALCRFLEPLHVIFEATVIDLNLMTNAEVAYHQTKQAELLTANLTEEHSPVLVAEVHSLRATLERMPPQLYAQCMALTELVKRSVDHGTLYFCQRMPGELANFHWRIDAKEKGNVTKYENWWKECVKPLIQSSSMRDPMPMLKGGDYSAFRRNFPEAPMPDYLQKIIGDRIETGIDIKAIFERSLMFQQSEDSVGLQIADILTNGVRRTLSGRLGPLGGKPIAALMIHRSQGALQFIILGKDMIAEPGYLAIAKAMNGCAGRIMLVDRKRGQRKRRIRARGARV